jgi:beta-glucosidase
VYREGLLVGYRGYDHAGTRPRFPFGHGLGYTTWTYEPAVADRTVLAPDGGLDVTAVLRNTGPRTGREVVQAYLERPPGEFIVRVGRSSADLPLQLRVRSS